MKYYPPRYLLRRYVLLREVVNAKRFLEIGPGEFQLSIELAGCFGSGTLVEFHDEAKELFLERIPGDLADRLELIIGDFTSMSLGGDYDCVVACEVLEHVEDESAFLDKAWSCLKPGGQLILSVPAHMRYWSKHDEDVGHLRRYDKHGVITALEKSGFSDIRIFSYGIPFIHIFRIIRVMRQHFLPERHPSDSLQRTKQSGIHHISTQWHWLSIFVNPYTFLPLNWFSRMFENTDLSDGYVITAKRK